MAKSKKNEKEKLPKELTRNAWILVVGAIAPMLDSTMVNIAINKLTHEAQDGVLIDTEAPTMLWRTLVQHFVAAWQTTTM